MLLNKTKIVATVGPASNSKEVLASLIEAGVNVFRLNFSHGTHEDHKKVIDHVSALNQEMGTHVALLADLGGPKLRVGEIKGNKMLLENDQIVTLTTKKVLGEKGVIPVKYKLFCKDVQADDMILINDGKLHLQAISSNKKDEVKAKVLHGGILSTSKGINLPTTNISLPSLTDNDRKDLAFVLTQDIEWIALSFVRCAPDVIELKHLIQEAGQKAKVIAKIEKPEAVKEIDDIIKEADAIMVARGDLGVEVPIERVPVIQKSIVKKCHEQAKPVIIATQMMETMIESVTPTRAEVSDVANAVTDGADAVMLSGETSVGKFPVKVIEMMKKIVLNTERMQEIYHKSFPSKENTERTISDAICENACKLTETVDVKAIVTMTFSGYSALKVSSFRPKTNVFACTSNVGILNTVSLYWGVHGLYYDKFVSTDHTIADIKFLLRKKGYVKENDLVINIASMPITDRGKSNMLKLSYVK